MQLTQDNVHDSCNDIEVEISGENQIRNSRTSGLLKSEDPPETIFAMEKYDDVDEDLVREVSDDDLEDDQVKMTEKEPIRV